MCNIAFFSPQLARDVYAKFLLNMLLPDGTSGEEIYHIIPEPALQYFIGFTVPKSSPFIQTFNSIIRDFYEFGFRQKSQMEYQNQVDVEKLNSVKLEKIAKDPNKVVMSLAHLQNVFILYILCTIACVIIFILEVWKFYFFYAK